MQDSSPTSDRIVVGAAPTPGTPSPAALELFYDLVFVAAVVVLSHSYSTSPTAGDLAWLVLVFVLVWLTWLQTSLLFNVHRSQTLTMRLLVLAQMMLLVLAAVSASDGTYRHSEYSGPILGAILLATIGMLWQAEHDDPALRSFTRPRMAGNAIAVVLLVSTPLWGDTAYAVVWLVAIAAALIPWLRTDPLSGARRDRDHLVERFGAFTIIMLGESFVKTALTATEDQMEGLDLVSLGGTFVIVFALWWLYFSDVPASRPPSSHRGHLTWLMVHLPLHLAIVGIAVGTARVVLIDDHAVAQHAIPHLALPLVGALVCLAVLAVMNASGSNTATIVVFLCAAVAVAVVGVSAAATDPVGIEATSVVLAAIMVCLVVSTTRIRSRGAGTSTIGSDG